jgi:hypothetical protein
MKKPTAQDICKHLCQTLTLDVEKNPIFFVYNQDIVQPIFLSFNSSLKQLFCHDKGTALPIISLYIGCNNYFLSIQCNKF